jgi:hypothetical protein
MVLTFTFVVAFFIVAAAVLVAVIEVRDPAADTTAIVRALVTTITLILGALLGLLASKTPIVEELASRPAERKSTEPQSSEAETEVLGQHRREDGQ